MTTNVRPTADAATRRRVLRGVALLLRVAVAVGLFAWLATRIEWKRLAATLSTIDPLLVVAGLLVLWCGLAAAVVRWQCLLRALRARLALGEITRIFGAGLFLSLFLPTGVGGDVYRLARASAGGFGYARAGTSLLFERGLGLLALWILMAPAVALHPQTRQWAPLSLALGAGAAVALITLWIAGGAITRWIAARLPALAPALGEESWAPIRRAMPAVLALSLFNHLTTIGSNWLFARALGLPLSPADALALVPLVVLAGQLPIAPGGLGVREAAFVYFYGRVGIAEEAAFAAGLVWLAALYLTGAIGAILFLADRRSGAAEAGNAAAGEKANAMPQPAALGGLDRARDRP